MKIEKLELVSFKNYLKSILEFNGKFICITGKNGQGKTNILDAIYYLSTTKSFLNPHDNSNINHNESFFRIYGSYQKDDNSYHNIVCFQERNQRKKIIVNEKSCEKFSDHIGNFPVVIISPSDFELLGGSDERRKFIDSTISQFDKTYLDNLLNYNRTLSHRNMLLKNIKEKRSSMSSLEPFDFKIEQYATPIHKMRDDFTKDFIPYFQDFYNKIAHESENVDIEYETKLKNNSMLDILNTTREKDLILGHTTEGIHREDFHFSINKYSLKKFGSQGQQKSFLIALKLAKYKYISQKKKNKPLLLIDDLHDRLDSIRVEKLFNMLNTDEFDQIFISDTQKERLFPLMTGIMNKTNFFNIENGTANIIEL